MSINKERCNKCNLGPCLPGKRKCEGLNEDLHSLGNPDTTDFYPPGGMVSVEYEKNKQLSLQQELDDAVAYENSFPEDPDLVTKRGLPPCKRVRNSY